MQLLSTTCYFYEDRTNHFCINHNSSPVMRVKSYSKESIVFHDGFNHLSHIIPIRKTSLYFHKYPPSRLSPKIKFLSSARILTILKATTHLIITPYPRIILLMNCLHCCFWNWDLISPTEHPENRFVVFKIYSSLL